MPYTLPETQQRPDLLYTVDEIPPTSTCLLLGFQHFLLILMYAAVLVIVTKATSGDVAYSIRMITSAMLISGLGTIIQSLRRGPLGSGFLISQTPSTLYLPLSLQAVQLGGFSLMAGMTIFSGAVTALLSRVVNHLKPVFTTEVCGVVVMSLGLTVISTGLARTVGYSTADPTIHVYELITGICTLVPMVCLSIWGRPWMKLSAFLVGFVSGYLAAWLLGGVPHDNEVFLAHAPWFAVPELAFPGVSFDINLLVPFLVLGVAGAMNTAGLIVSCQKNNDPDWKRADVTRVGSGMLADGLCVMCAGAVGSLGSNSLSSSVGLSMISSTTSRRLAWYAGGMLLVAIWMPKIPALLACAPNACMGAVLIYTAAFLLTTGMQLVGSRMLDERRLFMVGFSIIAGLSAKYAPWLFTHFPDWLHPLTSTPLTMATATAMVLNLLFRIGIKKKVAADWIPGQTPATEVYGFLEHWGRKWGARPEVIQRATQCLLEMYEILSGPEGASGGIQVNAQYNEFKLVLQLRYEGQPLDFSAPRPVHGELLASDTALMRHALHLVRSMSQKAECRSVRNGSRIIRLEFDH